MGGQNVSSRRSSVMSVGIRSPGASKRISIAAAAAKARHQSVFDGALTRESAVDGILTSRDAVASALKDKVNGLGYDEFRRLVRKTSPGISEEAVQARFGVIDKDRDGTVTADEYQREAHALQVMEEMVTGPRRVCELFSSCDLNRSGAISETEFIAAARKSGLPLLSKSSEDVLHSVFETLDTDQSGEITFHEFNAELHTLLAHDHHARHWAVKTRLRQTTSKVPGAALPPSAHVIKPGPNALTQLKRVLDQHRQKVVNLFHEWDEDRDGFVSRREFHKAMGLLGFVAAKATLDALFAVIESEGAHRTTAAF